jgi:hypothetical protein
MTALDQHGPWHEQIIAWMFPSSRVTHVVLVAALREAVFWIVATFARCQYVLTADAPLSLRRTGEAALRAAVADLLGLADAEGLRARAAATLALLPAVREAAEVISGGDAEGNASWPAE